MSKLPPVKNWSLWQRKSLMLRPMSSSGSRKFWAARVNREEIFLKPAGLPLFKPSVPNSSRSVVAVVAPAHNLPSELLFESLYLSERNVSRHLRNPLRLAALPCRPSDGSHADGKLGARSAHRSEAKRPEAN